MKPSASTDTLELSVLTGKPPEHAKKETNVEKDTQLNSLALHQTILNRDKPEEQAHKVAVNHLTLSNHSSGTACPITLF